jgi:hypothetical protein
MYRYSTLYGVSAQLEIFVERSDRNLLTPVSEEWLSCTNFNETNNHSVISCGDLQNFIQIHRKYGKYCQEFMNTVK